MMTADYAVACTPCWAIRAAEQRFQRPLGAVRLLAVGKTSRRRPIIAMAAAGQRDSGETTSRKRWIK